MKPRDRLARKASDPTKTKTNSDGKLMVCPAPTIQDELVKAAGVRTRMFACKLGGQVINLQSSTPDTSDADGLISEARMVLEEFAPRDSIEAMLSVQMLGAHDAAVEFMRRARLPGQPTQAIDSNVNRAARFMRVFMEQVEARARLRGTTGQQKMTVEHVHVHEGGQAIVGTLTAPGKANP